jgi:uncharacterized surface protein with fasciclin (FAS1) repeats
MWSADPLILAEASSSERSPTLQGQSLFLSYNKNPQINQSNTGCQGVRTSNGTVWIVDSVLMPQYFPMP